MTAQELLDALRDAYNCGAIESRPYDYSGRAMYGARCVAVNLESDGDLWELANRLGRDGLNVAGPRTDSMGRGIVAYWPSLKWPADEPSVDEDFEDEED